MGIIELARDAVKIVKQIDNIELYRKILDLQAEAQVLTDQLREKEIKIKSLERALELKDNIVLKGSAYYTMNEDGTLKDGPFCTKCFDVDHIVCRIVKKGKIGRHYLVMCQRCKNDFDDQKTYINIK